MKWQTTELFTIPFDKHTFNTWMRMHAHPHTLHRKHKKHEGFPPSLVDQRLTTNPIRQAAGSSITTLQEKASWTTTMTDFMYNEQTLLVQSWLFYVERQRQEPTKAPNFCKLWCVNFNSHSQWPRSSSFTRPLAYKNSNRCVEMDEKKCTEWKEESNEPITPYSN